MVRPIGFPEVLFSRGPLFSHGGTHEPPPPPPQEPPKPPEPPTWDDEPMEPVWYPPPDPTAPDLVHRPEIFGTDNSERLFGDNGKNLIW